MYYKAQIKAATGISLNKLDKIFLHPSIQIMYGANP